MTVPEAVEITRTTTIAFRKDRSKALLVLRIGFIFVGSAIAAHGHPPMQGQVTPVQTMVTAKDEQQDIKLAGYDEKLTSFSAFEHNQDDWNHKMDERVTALKDVQVEEKGEQQERDWIMGAGFSFFGVLSIALQIWLAMRKETRSATA